MNMIVADKVLPVLAKQNQCCEQLWELNDEKLNLPAEVAECKKN